MTPSTYANGWLLLDVQVARFHNVDGHTLGVRQVGQRDEQLGSVLWRLFGAQQIRPDLQQERGCAHAHTQYN